MGEYEKTCVICNKYRNINEYEFLDTSKEESIFTTVSSHLSVTESLKLWDFLRDPLPFCSGCKVTAAEIECLTKNIKDLQSNLTDKVQLFYRMVRQISTNEKDNNRNSTGQESHLQDWGAIKLDFTSLMELTHNSTIHVNEGVSDRYSKYRQEVLSRNGENTVGYMAVPGKNTTNDFEASTRLYQGPEDRTKRGESGTHASLSELELTQFHAEQLDGNYSESPSRINILCDETMIPVSSQELQDESPPFTSTEEENKNFRANKLTVQRWEERGNGHYYMNVRTIMEDNEHKCQAEECSWTISMAKENYKKRMAYHIKERHYGSRKCPAVGCTKRFLGLNETDLNIHLEKDHLPLPRKENQGTQSQVCPKCKKTYKDRRSFKNHVSTCCSNQRGSTAVQFSGGSILQCLQCDKTFKKKSNFSRHMLTHEKSLDERKTQMCEFCAKWFTQDGLKEHLKNVHKQCN